MGRTTIKGPITDGARALATWLDERALSASRFAELNRIDRVQLLRAMNGERVRISIDLAATIEKATAGAVRCHLWATWTKEEVSA